MVWPSNSYVLGVGRQKEHAQGPRQALGRAEAHQDEPAKTGSAPQGGFANSLVLHEVPDLLVGFEFRRIRRQKEQPQFALLAGHEVAQRATAVNRVPIEDQKHGLRQARLRPRRHRP